MTTNISVNTLLDRKEDPSLTGRHGPGPDGHSKESEERVHVARHGGRGVVSQCLGRLSVLPAKARKIRGGIAKKPLTGVATIHVVRHHGLGPAARVIQKKGG